MSIFTIIHICSKNPIEHAFARTLFKIDDSPSFVQNIYGSPKAIN